MKYMRIFVMALLAMLLAGEVDAQVSVRRSSRSTSEKNVPARGSRNKDKNKDKESGKKDKDANAKPTTPKPASGNNKGANGANPNPVVKKGNTNKKQSQSTVLTDGKTLRQQAFDEYQKDEAVETPWQHIVYRELDLTKDANASLYFPIEPMNGLTNLFRVIIDAFSKGELPAYEYLDGREVFTDAFRVKPKDIFDKFDIYYTAKPAENRSKDTLYIVDESNVPSASVLSYFVKERWEFDQKHSKYQRRILCLCPVLHSTGDFSADAVKYPMFWLNYEDLRPYLRDHLVVNQGMNTAARFTMEEFFSLGQYEGDIYKEQNLRGLSLKQQVGDNPDSLKMAQQKLDNDLRAFEDSIWIKDPVPTAAPERKAAHRKLTRSLEGKATTEVKNDSTSVSRDGVENKKNRRTKETVDMEAVEEEKNRKATTHKSVRR